MPDTTDSPAQPEKRQRTGRLYVCPYSAISRVEAADGSYEYVVDAERCIGCGFCAGACPCGIWDLVENTPL